MSSLMCHAEDCGRPTHDNATLCQHCTRRLGERLFALATFWPELVATLTRQDALPAGQGHSDARIVYNPAASEAMWAVSNTLTTWARVVSEELGIDLPEPIQHTTNEVRCALWLRGKVSRIRLADYGPELLDEADVAAELAERTIDRPADKVYLAQCDICGQDLYAAPGAGVTTCRGCMQVYDVSDRRHKVLARAESHTGTASEIARALTSLGDPVTPERIRKWAQRGHLVSRGWLGSRPMYRVGDVRDLLARHAETGGVARTG